MKDKTGLEEAHNKERAELEAKHAAELVNLDRETALKKILPHTGFPVSFVHFCKGAPTSVSYRVRGLADVLRIVAAFRLVPYKDAKADGCRVLLPAGLMAEKYKKETETGSGEWTAPIFHYHAYAQIGPSASFEFWARVGPKKEVLKISVDADYYRSGGGFGFWAHCQRMETPAGSYVVRGSWKAPSIEADQVVKWGTGDDQSAQWSLCWRTLEKFNSVFGAHVEERAKAAEESRKRAKADYLARRNEGEIRAKCRFVLETLALPAVVKALGGVPQGWTLDTLRACGYRALQDAVQKGAPEVLRVGIHDFLNTAYYLSPDMDATEDCHPDYRDDLRAVFAEEAAKHGRA